MVYKVILQILTRPFEAHIYREFINGFINYEKGKFFMDLLDQSGFYKVVKCLTNSTNLGSMSFNIYSRKEVANFKDHYFYYFNY
jgi:hypothetical protein